MIATLPLTDLLDREDIHLHFRAGSIVESIPQLLRPALQRRIQDTQLVNTIIDAAVKREQDTPTTCGALALPHARNANLQNFVLTLGANAEGAIDGHPNLRLIFAFASPEAKREQHLQLLASLARLSQNPKVIDQIVSASDAGAVMETLRDAGV